MAELIWSLVGAFVLSPIFAAVFIHFVVGRYDND